MDYTPHIWILDYVLCFLYIIVIYFGAFLYKKEKEKKDPDYKYFLVALSAKVFGGMGFLLLTVYYWGGGDTYTYYHVSNGFTEFFFQDPSESLELLFSDGHNINWDQYQFAYSHSRLLRTTNASFMIVKITSLVNLISCKSFVVSTIMFAFLSFLGVWNMYWSFCKVYPHLKKQLLYAIFFIPSVVLWGSGILKDTVTMACIGWIVYSFINIVLLKRKQGLSLFLIFMSTMTLFYLKPYILYVLYPALFVWFQSNLKTLITSNLFRAMLAPFILITILISSYFLVQKLSENAERYSLDNLEDTLEGFQSWHTTVSESKNQSGYTLGDMEFTPMGIVKKIPMAINVTFFRPYVWEISNASTLLGAIEGVVLLVFSLWVVLTLRLKLFALIFKNKDILFLLLFAVIFGAVVGISSYNFGALSRYKMPAQMFYVLALILIFDKRKKQQGKGYIQ
ncbi:MAG: hypothetical protein KDD41_11385 [Flavobacteriales bacterium]|nr:hypothetical protein [Flavobacteriales bacterium]